MKKRAIEIKWGLIFFVVALLWMVLEKGLGLHDKYISQHAIYTNLFAIPAILLYVFALLDKRRNFYYGHITYRQAFTSGAIITAIVMVLSPVSQLIVHYLITPDYFATVSKYAVSTGQMTPPEAENYFNLPSYMMQAIIGAAVLGLLTSALVALFVKRTTHRHPADVEYAGK
ncbi:DUF4199 domain-containing protein [Roseivirga sp. BDSF3-8]|uniref:DUF4199 domain-containing protein n=1 Tax=Roseivirga sp. BDSF3-8 TaxID=3241598 RepID=UPI003531CD08